jgi:DNA-directed RNA polymerase subunit H (RpoH/RPB5)
MKPTHSAADDAKAERRLADMKAKRIAEAERKRDAAHDGKAEAQAAADKAAEHFAVYPSPGNRQRLLDARAEVEVMTGLAEHCERALVKAKERFTPGQRAAALQLVQSERDAAGFMQRVDPVVARVATKAGDLIEIVRELFALVGDQQHHRFEQKSACEQLGLPFDDRLMSVVSPLTLAADAILRACRANHFAPYDWRDMDPVRVNGAMPPIPGAQATTEPIEEMHKRNEAWQARLHSEAAANDTANRVQAVRIARDNDDASRAAFDEQTRRIAEMHEQAGSRASIAE